MVTICSATKLIVGTWQNFVHGVRHADAEAYSGAYSGQELIISVSRLKMRILVLVQRLGCLGRCRAECCLVAAPPPRTSSGTKMVMRSKRSIDFDRWEASIEQTALLGLPAPAQDAARSQWEQAHGHLQRLVE